MRGPALEEIHLRLDASPPCTRCEGPTLLLARFAHSWTNGNGQVVPRRRTRPVATRRTLRP
ncbi:DUF6300 family protein [Streptomyces echinatus]|uniref:DUF6300 family protein n=1 Tax=Streptomyces echinatus TaxID=67293 RepID=UPI00378BF5AA